MHTGLGYSLNMCMALPALNLGNINCTTQLKGSHKWSKLPRLSLPLACSISISRHEKLRAWYKARLCYSLPPRVMFTTNGQFLHQINCFSAKLTRMVNTSTCWLCNEVLVYGPEAWSYNASANLWWVSICLLSIIKLLKKHTTGSRHSCHWFCLSSLWWQ